MLSGQELEKGILMLQIIWAALTMSLIMYVLAVPLMFDEIAGTFPADAYADLRLILYGSAFATLVASWFVRHFILAAKVSATPSKSRQHPALQRYTTALIFSLALTESIGLYGLVLYLLGKSQTDLYLLTALSAAAMTLYFPRKRAVIRFAEHFARRS